MSLAGPATAVRPLAPTRTEETAPRRRARIEELEQQIERLLPRLRIAVIFGGDKTAEGAVINRTVNPRPWKSYEKVAHDLAASLSRIGFREVVALPDDMQLGERLRRAGTHLAWLNTGGVQGFGAMSHAAAMLEMFGVPYLGHDPITTSILDSKHLFKRELALLGLPTAPFMAWHPARGPLAPHCNPRFRQAFGDHPGPFVVKPVSGRASHHVRMVEERGDLEAAVAEVYAATDNHVLIETFLSGAEYCIAVAGPVIARGGRLVRLNGPFTFSAVERRLDEGERIFTSMDQRPITVDRLRLLTATVDGPIHADLHALGRAVFEELDLETLVRLDLRADAAGRLHVLEANPKPDLAAPIADRTSLVCAGLPDHGMSYDDLVLGLLADRLDILFCRRRGSAHRLLDLVG
jgi:D-alanine-D-alanine ligase